MGVLIDRESGLVYVPFSRDLLDELRDWSQPLQLRWVDGYETIEVRDMRQPVKGVYIKADEQLDMAAPSREYRSDASLVSRPVA